MIELRDVSFQYKLDKDSLLLALDNIDLKFNEGEFVAIIGPNGSGKTTLARLLNALLLPSKGKVFVDGLDTVNKEDQKRIRLLVGMVFQNPDNQFISTTVEREIAFGLENLALSHQEIKQRVGWALSTFNLEKLKRHSPHKLSGGEKQKVALASVLAMRPKYLVLDEPTSLLDPKGREEFNILVNNLFEKSLLKKKLTIFHITQFPEEAMSAQRILVLDQGKIFLDGGYDEVFSKIEELKKIGLGVPLAQEILFELNKFGIKFKKKVHDFDGLVDELKSLKNNLSEVEQTLEVFSTKESKVEKKESFFKIIQSKNLSFVYDQKLPQEKRALDNVSFEIEKGDFLGIIGPTGSGKSTLVQHLNALLFPTEGEVIVDNISLSKKYAKKNTDYKKLRKIVGLSFQFPELQLFEETVFEDVAFGPKNINLPDEKIKNRVKESLSLVGLDFEKFAFRSPYSLSDGEKRKVAIAGILALDPEVLILDEPTCGLDLRGIEDIKNLLKKLSSKRKTIILISHDIDLVAELAKKIMLLSTGKLVCFCKKENFFEDLKNLGFYRLKSPRILELVKKLQKAGFKIESEIFTKEKLIKKLLTFLKK